MSINKFTVKKYKTYFTIAEMESLRDDSKNAQMKRYLNKRLRAIDEGDIAPEFSRSESVAVQLGLLPRTDVETTFQKEQERRYMSNEMTPEEEKEFEVKQFGAKK